MARQATPEEAEVIRRGLTAGKSNAEIGKDLKALGSSDAGIEAAGGGPEDPAADAAAVANTARKAAQAASSARKAEKAAASSATRSRSSAAQTARTVYRSAPAPSSALYPSSSSPTVGAASKVIWAIAAFVLVMEGLSYLTGQYFDWNLGQALAPAKTQSYVPLYSPAPTTVAVSSTSGVGSVGTAVA